MKKLFIKLINAFGLYTKYQILDEVSEVIELIVSLDENMSSPEEEKQKKFRRWLTGRTGGSKESIYGIKSVSNPMPKVWGKTNSSGK